MILIFQIVSALAFVAAAGLFTVLALAPPGTDLGVFANNPNDKFGHAAAFFVLGPLASAGFPRLGLIWITAGLVLLGIGLEFGQSVTGREFSLEDIAANLIGLAAGLFPQLAYQARLSLRLRFAARATEPLS